MITRIYVVVGSSGVYEDRAQWIVGARRTEVAARRFAKLCQKQVDKEFDKIKHSPFAAARHEFKTGIDPSCILDFGRKCRSDKDPFKPPAPDEYEHNVSYRVVPTILA
jgi:hypothetical protein